MECSKKRFMLNDHKASSTKEMMNEFKEDMVKTFEMTDLSMINYFLSIEVKQQKEDIFISQKKYIEALLKKFKMYDCVNLTLLH